MFSKLKKTKTITVKVYEEDYNELRENAEREGVPLATWVRALIFRTIKGRAFNED